MAAHPATERDPELVSTVDDYLAFCCMLLNHGRHERTRVLSRPSVELMVTNHLTPEQTLGAEIFLGACSPRPTTAACWRTTGPRSNQAIDD